MPRTRPHRVLDLLHHVSESLDQVVDPEVAAWSVLVAMTAGEGLAFNRAFLLLEEEGVMRGFVGVGPSSRAEARELWADLRHKEIRPLDTLGAPDPLAVAIDRMRHDRTLELLTHPTAKGCGTWQRSFVARVNHPHPCVRHWMAVLESQSLVVVPLMSEDEPWGVVLADNFVTHDAVSPGALEAAETLAHTLRTAVERARLLRRLQEEKRRRIEAEHSTALLETARSLAHDLKNPLALAGGLAGELASSPALDKDTLVRRLRMIRAAIARAEGRVSQLTEGLASRAHPIEIEMVDVGPLAERTCEQLRPLATSRNVHVLCYHPTKRVRASAAASALERCLENLLGNALQALAGQPGEIRVAVLDDGQWIRIEVADNGPPLPATLRADPFAGGVTTRRGGSGLGLASVRALVEAMEGKVEYDETEPGWVRFTVFLRRWL